MGSKFAITFEERDLSSPQDLFQCVPPSNHGILIHAIYLGQTSDFSDAEDENILVRIIRGYTSDGSDGYSATPVNLQEDGENATVIAETNNTTLASGGSPVTLHVDTFNVRSGWVYLPTPETRIHVAGGTRVVVNVSNSPLDPLTISGTLIYEIL